MWVNRVSANNFIQTIRVYRVLFALTYLHKSVTGDDYSQPIHHWYFTDRGPGDASPIYCQHTTNVLAIHHSIDLATDEWLNIDRCGGRYTTDSRPLINRQSVDISAGTLVDTRPKYQPLCRWSRPIRHKFHTFSSWAIKQASFFIVAMIDLFFQYWLWVELLDDDLGFMCLRDTLCLSV